MSDAAPGRATTLEERDMAITDAAPPHQQPSGTSRGSLLGSAINRFATPLTTGLFAVSGVSGVALFFHWAPAAFHEMHEWLSMVLLLPFAMHVGKNWRPLAGYARRGTLFPVMTVAVLVAMPFAASALMRSGAERRPSARAVKLLTQARLADLAPVLRTTPNALLANLRRQGLLARSPEESLADVANASGQQSPDLLAALMPAR